jgi:hypothetical protein
VRMMVHKHATPEHPRNAHHSANSGAAYCGYQPEYTVRWELGTQSI